MSKDHTMTGAFPVTRRSWRRLCAAITDYRAALAECRLSAREIRQQAIEQTQRGIVTWLREQSKREGWAYNDYDYAADQIESRQYLNPRTSSDNFADLARLAPFPTGTNLDTHLKGCTIVLFDPAGRVFQASGGTMEGMGIRQILNGRAAVLDLLNERRVADIDQEAAL